MKGPALAFGFMVAAACCFAAMAVAARVIIPTLDSFELMLYRSVIGFAIIAAACWLSPAGLRQAATGHPGLHVLRNLFHFTGQNLWFLAVVALPLGQMVALEFTLPIWVVLFSAVLLSERLTGQRWLAVGIGFLGVLIVARPGVTPLAPGHGLALAAAVAFALNTIFTKKIMSFDSVLCVLFWMTLSQAAMGLALGLPGGVPWPPLGLWPWLVVTGLAGIGAHLCLTFALSIAPASQVAPMEFVRLPIMAGLGLALYAEAFDPFVLVGAVVILGANLLNLRDRPPPRSVAEAFR